MVENHQVGYQGSMQATCQSTGVGKYVRIKNIQEIFN